MLCSVWLSYDMFIFVIKVFLVHINFLLSVHFLNFVKLQLVVVIFVHD